MNQHDSRRLIDALLDRSRYRHPVTRIELAETHANWVVLAGDYAYKIKKPVDLGFLDFSTLEKRRFFCEEELRLNRRLAPELYMRVIPIAGTVDEPCLDGDGEPIEYAVLMKRFDPENGVDRLLESGDIAVENWDAFARNLAGFHREAPAASPDSGFGSPQTVRQNVIDNFEPIASRIGREDRKLLRRIEQWSRERFETLRPYLESRRRNQHIRECHGDLHCANLVLWEGRILAFDCLEFSESLRWIDTANEIAFLLMDLRYRGHPELAARWRSLYFEWTGDYDAVCLLDFYESYRALVRCKVALLAAEQAVDDPPHADSEHRKARRYLQVASDCMRQQRPAIIITHGLAGSGKSTLGLGLLQVLPALRLRSDIERKRLFGLDPLAESGSRLDAGIYHPEATERTYRRLAELAGMLLDAGQTVVVDATFLDRTMRNLFHDTARKRDLPFVIMHADAPRHELERRIRNRRRDGRDPSEADIRVLEGQIESADELGADERSHTVEVDTTEAVDYRHLAERIRSLIS